MRNAGRIHYMENRWRILRSESFDFEGDVPRDAVMLRVLYFEKIVE